MARMVRKQVYIDDRQDALLKAEAERTGQTESALIRRAIDSLLDPEVLRREAAESARRFDEMADRAAEEIAKSGQKLHWPGREELYRYGRPR